MIAKIKNESKSGQPHERRKQTNKPSNDPRSFTSHPNPGHPADAAHSVSVVALALHDARARTQMCVSIS